MKEITITNRIVNNTAQFIMTDTTNNIIMVFQCGIENIGECSTDVWVEVTENVNGITTNITDFYMDDVVRLYETIRDFVGYALRKNVKAVNFDFMVSRVSLTYVKHMIEVVETMILRR